MCLKVKDVVNNCVAARVMKAYKCLGYDGRTYFQASPIPRDGLLLPRYLMKKTDFSFYDSIDGGLIHSYYSTEPAYYGSRYDAFAIGVLAWGTNRDQVSVGLYIPDRDKTPDKEERVKILGRDKAPSVAKLLEIFPRLKRVERLLR